MNLSAMSDYRDLLKDFYDVKKLETSNYSYRRMAFKIGLDSSHLHRILAKRQHLPLESVPLTKRLLKLNAMESEMFDLQIAFSRTKNAHEKARIWNMYAELQSILRSFSNDVGADILESFYAPVIKSLLEVTRGVGEPKKLSEMFLRSVSLSDVKSALNILLECRQIAKISSGKFKRIDYPLTVVETNNEQSSCKTERHKKAVRAYQHHVFSEAKEALDNVPHQERDFTTLTISVDDECFEDLCNIIVDFKRQVQRRINAVRFPNRVMHLGLALFPVTKKEEW